MEALRLTRDMEALPEGYWSQPDPPALAFATSGSTGAPQWIVHSRAALLTSAAAVNQALGVGTEDVWLRALPLSHVAGVGVEARAFLTNGSAVRMTEAWNAETFMKCAVDAKASFVSLVPTQVFDLVQASYQAPSTLRTVLVGGGRLEAPLAAAAQGLGWNLRASYGLTEAASTVAMENAAGALELLDIWEARVNASGLLELRGPVLAEPGWFTTNDRVELAGRTLRWLGRADLLVKIRGELVDLEQVERRLTTLEGAPVIVLALPDSRIGHRLVAGGIAQEGLELYQSTCPALERLSGVFPARIVVRSSLGKVQRAATLAALTPDLVTKCS